MEAARFTEGGPVPRVLVADADANERSLFNEALHVAGCDVIEAADGREALAKALVRPLSLVVSDVELPFINGYELCALLRQDSMTRTTPIILLTDEACTEDVNRARAAGANLTLVRPTSPAALLGEARRLMAASRDLRVRAQIVREKVAAQLQKSASLQERSASVQRAFLKGTQRHATTTPPLEPPALVCPSCDRPLIYQHSYTGGVGVKHSEQWDYYRCPGNCGSFQYRQRTRTLRIVR
jgi:two-component system, chemotaxis family, chemotaxis protein CheY